MLARPSLSGTEEFDAGMDAMEAISGRRHRLGSTIPNSTQLAGLKLTSLLVCVFLCVEISWLDDKPWLWIWIWVPLQGPWEPTAALYLQLHFAAVIWRARLSLSLWFHM